MSTLSILQPHSMFEWFSLTSLPLNIDRKSFNQSTMLTMKAFNMQ